MDEVIENVSASNKSVLKEAENVQKLSQLQTSGINEINTAMSELTKGVNLNSETSNSTAETSSKLQHESSKLQALVSNIIEVHLGKK